MGFELVSIRNGNTEARVSPSRGAIAASWVVDGVEQFYMAQNTFDDPQKSVRGGNPFLWPFAGALEEGTLVEAGTKMAQHGFGRDKVWTIEAKGSSMLALSLEPDDQTREVFPWDFRMVQTFEVSDAVLSINLVTENRSDRAMPVAPGWHPYYPIKNASKPAVEVGLPGFKHTAFANPEGTFNFGVESNGTCAFTFQIEDRKLRMAVSPNLQWYQFWSLPGSDFICVEPFAGPPNVINTRRCERIAPGGRSLHWMSLQVLR
jgi:galactose mutarotase-like enzyme